MTPLWRQAMHRRVLDHYQGDITKANIHPRTRAKVLAKYGPGTPEAEASAARVAAARGPARATTAA